MVNVLATTYSVIVRSELAQKETSSFIVLPQTHNVIEEVLFSSLGQGIFPSILWIRIFSTVVFAEYTNIILPAIVRSDDAPIASIAAMFS